MAQAVRVEGLRELQRALRNADKGVRKGVRDELRQVGQVVRVEAARRFASVDARSAAGYRVVVRQRGVAVEQRLRRTTGRHPDYGAKQMREALLPALDAKENEVVKALERMLDRVGARNGF